MCWKKKKILKQHSTQWIWLQILPLLRFINKWPIHRRRIYAVVAVIFYKIEHAVKDANPNWIESSVASVIWRIVDTKTRFTPLCTTRVTYYGRCGSDTNHTMDAIRVTHSLDILCALLIYLQFLLIPSRFIYIKCHPKNAHWYRGWPFPSAR